ncbi:extracellular tyrosine-protein kinase PKDCC isoform X2 [Nilaparvata lugens]|uniref:extracellular tyrosine-protein kinase PKDCC isoform X2 n=1 Tax=Nilaparvata lugens TaxID=108931 RepID=UPI00193E625C|nr:extracellular tyrosine-protein kinase PKDCC isoform X2 [Nilaparvata lugens]
MRRWRCVDRVCSTGLRLFCLAYVCLFAVAGVVLLRHRSTSFSPRTYFSAESSEWPTLDSFLSKSDRWSALQDGSKLDCSSLQDMLEVQSVAYGWTKAVYRAVLRGQAVAIKTVNMHGRDMMQCLGRGPHEAAQWQRPTSAECYRRAANKIIKEVAILIQLAPHHSFIQVLGACVPDASGPVIVMTELGEPLDTVQLLRLPWIKRLKLAKSIAEMLVRLAHSPLGSLAMNDLRRQQFVLVDDSLKLSDVDDVGMAEPHCSRDNECHIRSDNNTVIDGVSCVNRTCSGYNERLNIWRAGQHFIKQFLPIDVPPFLESRTRALMDAYERRSPSAGWDAKRILVATDNLLQLYHTQHNPPQTTHKYGSRKIPEEV